MTSFQRFFTLALVNDPAICRRVHAGGGISVRRGKGKANWGARAAMRGYDRIALAAAVLAVTLLGLVGAAAARPWRGAAAYGPVFEWILLDADTGQVLSEQNADTVTYPASLTKMMTLYLTFEALNQSRITLDQQFPVSEFAATRAPSRLGLRPGDSVSVRDLILGIVTKSANDAAAVLAEGLGGSEANFANMMSWKARQLGMDHSWYDNASGLPDSPGNRTTARDVARLALALYHRFPREYRYFAVREFDFRGQTVRGHDHLLDWYPGADGIKTGFINASGFNLATSAVRGGHRLIGVILGGRTWRSRDEEMASLLDQGFAYVAATHAPAAAGPVVAAATPRAEFTAAPTATAAATPAPAAIAPARPAPAVAVAQAAPSQSPVDRANKQRDASFLKHVANAALQHLAPVARAEAAPLAREPRAESWAIQLGAFRDEAAAEHAARQAAKLLRGKPSQVLAPARSERPRLYRARLLNFTAKGAEAACAELHHRRMACTIVRPASVKVASR